MISQELLFQAIKNEEWEFLISTLHKNKKEINSEPLLTLAAKTFISEFLNRAPKYPEGHLETVSNLEMLWVIDKGNYFKLNKDDHKKLICQLVERKGDNLIEAYNYAQEYPDEIICKNIIIEYEKIIPTTIEHTQNCRISVTERKVVAHVDYTSNLFKSRQEIEFFRALKITYDSYQIYPNVAISCLLNWQLLRDDLTTEEKDFFFKGIIDFVVFDQAVGFKPIHFFELDSIYHDSEAVKNRDKIKDSIFAKAGVKIKRVRKHDNSVTDDDFVKLIRELTR